jgi:hypothetical protein
LSRYFDKKPAKPPIFIMFMTIIVTNRKKRLNDTTTNVTNTAKIDIDKAMGLCYNIYCNRMFLGKREKNPPKKQYGKGGKNDTNQKNSNGFFDGARDDACARIRCSVLRAYGEGEG